MNIEVEDLKRVHLGPGDKLLVKVPRGAEGVGTIHAVLTNLLGKDAFLIYTEDAEITGVVSTLSDPSAAS